MGGVFESQKKYDNALEFFNKALRFDPNSVATYTNMGIALRKMKRLEEAVKCLNKAISLMPSYSVAYLALSETQKEMQLFEEALKNAEKAIALDPKLKGAFAHRYAMRAQNCKWNYYDEDTKTILKSAESGLANFNPFLMLRAVDSLRLQHKIAFDFGNDFIKKVNKLQSPDFSRIFKTKLRIGYFSGDFRNHPMSQLIVGLFEKHDRSKFEIIAFSLGPNTGDIFHKRIIQAVDEFFPVEKLGTADLAALVHEKQIDIAIDLTGYTDYARTEIFALRVAPVQVNFLGYPGTMGASFMDYIIADETLIPLASCDSYTEKIIYMPHCYMPSDNSRQGAVQKFERQELGLPATGVIYCVFNNVAKLNPPNFSSWMNILKAVEGSVLWLQAKNELAISNLKAEATVRGVDPDRIMFTAQLPYPEHFALYRCADIFLDSLPYNAHTTANEALWCGLPVLTQIGESFAGRVAASLLRTLGLDELITHSIEEYEAKAIYLGLNPKEIARIKDKLELSRSNSPLFNTELYARHIENAYQKMHDRFAKILPPDHIFVDC